jgi:hypothetical protein
VRQLDVHQNESPRTRRLFPLVTVLQHHRAETGRDRVVVPMVPEERLLPDVTRRLLPRVRYRLRRHRAASRHGWCRHVAPPSRGDQRLPGRGGGRSRPAVLRRLGMSPDPASARRWACITLLTLTACAPVYEPSYRLEPPADAARPDVRQCLATCGATRDACRVSANARRAACEDRASLMQNSCQSNAQIRFQQCLAASRSTGEDCSMRICERPRCPTEAVDACEAGYRGCFADCGGTVVEERRCVANCPS